MTFDRLRSRITQHESRQRKDKLLNKIPIALELYSVRNEMKENVSTTLHAVAEMGYEG